MSMRGGGGGGGGRVTFDRDLEIICIILELRSQIWSLVPMRIYAYSCSIEKVRIILVQFRFYDQIIRILSA